MTMFFRRYSSWGGQLFKAWDDEQECARWAAVSRREGHAALMWSASLAWSPGVARSLPGSIKGHDLDTAFARIRDWVCLCLLGGIARPADDGVLFLAPVF